MCCCGKILKIIGLLFGAVVFFLAGDFLYLMYHVIPNDDTIYKKEEEEPIDSQFTVGNVAYTFYYAAMMYLEIGLLEKNLYIGGVIGLVVFIIMCFLLKLPGKLFKMLCCGNNKRRRR